MQALEGYTSERRWLRHAHTHLRHLFPYLPGQSGYNKRLRAASYLVTYMIRVLARDTAAWHDDVWVVDSTPVECARSRDAVMRSDLAGWAQYGYCASHSLRGDGGVMRLPGACDRLPCSTSARDDADLCPQGVGHGHDER
jgi:hypothetical protein